MIVDNLSIQGVDRCSDPGHPCYEVPGGINWAVFDDFNRTTSDGSLGTASSGSTWSNDGYAGLWLYVDETDLFFDGYEYGSDNVSWFIAEAPVLLESGLYPVSAKIKMRAFDGPDDPSWPDPDSIEFTCQLSINGSEVSLNVGKQYIDGFGYQMFTTVNSVASPVDPRDENYFWLEVYDDGVTLYSKIWADGGAEPLDWLTSGPSGTVEAPQVVGLNVNVWQTFTQIRVDQIEIGSGYYATPVLPVSEEPVVSGRRTQVFPGGRDVYSLGSDISPDSVLLYINGILTSGATATSDGVVTLPYVTHPMDSVMISYMAAGA